MIRTLSPMIFLLAMMQPILADGDASKPKDFNEDILIFTGEVRNFVDMALAVKELNASEQTPETEKALEEKIKILQVTAARVADAYFHVADEANRSDLTKFLGKTFKENSPLKNYFIFVGNAFASEAQKLLEERSAKMKKIHVWSTVGGVVLGLAGGYVFLKYKGGAGGNNLLQAGLVAVGLAAVVSGAGYSARYFLPVDGAVTNAKDFLTRYPHGEDFLRDLDTVSPDLAMGMATLGAN